jgi:hypothetical protein
MTGYELLKLLTEQTPETLAQEVLFEFEVLAAPDRVYSSQVPIVQPLIVDADRILYPDSGFITLDQALEQYNQAKQEAAAGLFDWDEIGGEAMYHPMMYPIVLKKDQLLMKLAPTKSYNDEPEPKTKEELIIGTIKEGNIPHLRVERE